MIGFLLFNFTLQIGTHWGVLYPSSTQRGQAPQAAHIRPLIVAPFEFHTGAIRGEKQVELYAKANVDDYAFKSNIFSSTKMI